MTQPASVTFDGTDLVLWVPAIADPEYPALSELEAGGVLDVSCYFTDTGWNPSMTEDKVNDNRLCSRINFSKPGRKTFDVPLLYVFNPESPDDDEARTTLVDGATGYFVERPAADSTVPIAAWDYVWVYPVELGKPFRGSQTANMPWIMSQTAHVRPPGVTDLVPVIAS